MKLDCPDEALRRQMQKRIRKRHQEKKRKITFQKPVSIVDSQAHPFIERENNSRKNDQEPPT
jgi:hypothetical protein